MKQTKTLHILNGMEMYHFFTKTHYLEDEVMIPFNEAMCYGNTSDDLFSDNFNEIRAKVHHVTLEQYAEITLNPLKPLFEFNFNRLILWFDDDMFCQINVLTILAWLDRKEYRGEAILKIVGNKFQLVESFNIERKGYYEIYKQVMLRKQTTKDIYPGHLKRGIKLYLSYQNEESDLMLFIKKHKDVPTRELVQLLISNFKHYGFGDTQYVEIINSCRNRL
ncbi:AraC family transcriptional regulator [Bacillus nitroreducens]